MDINQFVNYLKEVKGLTITEIAQTLKISKQAVSVKLQNKSMTTDSLIELLRAMETPLIIKTETETFKITK